MYPLELNERDLRALRIFKEVALAGGFSAAQNALHMTTATISRQVKEIEERMGVKLCARGPQGFALTEAGEAALARIQDALDAIGRIMPAVDETRNIVSGQLNIGILDNVIDNEDCHLMEAIRRFRHVAPRVKIDLQTLTKSDVVKSITDHRFHILICGAFDRLPTLDYHHLFDEVQTIYYHTRAEAPRSLPLVHRAIDGPIDEFMYNNEYRKGPSAGGLQSVAFLVATGEFLGVLPRHYARQLAGGQLEAIPDAPTFTIPFYAITNTTRPLPASAERFIDVLKECHAAA